MQFHRVNNKECLRFPGSQWCQHICAYVPLTAWGLMAGLLREQSSSRSWLAIVEAPGCLRHSSSVLAIQLLITCIIFKFHD